MTDAAPTAERFAAHALEVPSSPTRPPATGGEAPSAYGGAPGIERLRANLEGRVPPPPSWYLLGWRLVEVSEGRVAFDFQPLPAHTSYGGNAHGGVLAALADSAMGCAILSLLPGDHWCATLEIKINFLRPVTVPGEVVRAVGTVRWRGSSIALTEASLEQGGSEVATASSLYAIRRNRRLPGQPGTA